VGCLKKAERGLLKYIKYGSAAVVTAALLWSLDGLLRRHLYTLPAPVIVFYEHLFGFIILAPIILATFKAFKKLTRRQWLSIIGVSFLSGAVGTILYTAALGRVNFIPFSVVVLLQQLNPVFAIAAAAILLKEPLNRRFYSLTALALLGAYLATFPKLTVNFSTGKGALIAALMAIGAAAAWGTSTAFSKYSLAGTSSLHVTAARFGITPLFALAFVFLSGSSKSLSAISFSQFKYLVAITFSTGLVALIIYYFGLKRIPASRAAVLELAWPGSAVFVGWIFLHQGLSAVQIIGAVLLVSSIYLMARDAQALASKKQKVKA